MLDDVMEMNDEIEDEAEEEVHKILLELTSGILGEARKAGHDLPETEEFTETLPEIDDQMEARLASLKS